MSRLLFCCSQTFVLIFAISSTWSLRPGPQFQATNGKLWPAPLMQDTSPQYYIVNIANLRFDPVGETCLLLDYAINRCWRNVQRVSSVPITKLSDWSENDAYYLGKVDRVEIELINPCSGSEMPTENMDESYTILANKFHEVSISGHSIWGVMRGLESFSQLVRRSSDGSTLLLNVTFVDDKPRFPHRGLLIDTSRHFIPKDILLQNLDAMEYNKLNVFHWHITDDQSFPYQSIKFPEMAENGAYHPITMIYAQKDVKDVIEHAPASYLTPCGFHCAPMDPSNEEIYPFLKDFYLEVINVFPDNFVHIGGDEVDHECWSYSTQISDFMEKHNMSKGDYVALENYFVTKVIDIVHNLGARPVVWEEVFVNGAELPNGTVVQVWKDDGMVVLKSVVESGFFGILSSCWYLDHLGNGGDWTKFYKCDPYDVIQEHRELILGGEACMWTESVNQYNIISRIWPRASAVAEKLWSPSNSNPNLNNPSERLEEHTCRMNARGIPAQPPNGAGFCP